MYKIRTKTLLAVVRHVTGTLPTPGQGLWEPLSGDYLKTLRTLLHYPSHLEHLNTEAWTLLVDFCLRGIGVEDVRHNTQLPIRNGHHLATDSGDQSRSRSISVEPSSYEQSRASRTQSTGNLEDLEICLQLLSSSTSAPIPDEADRLLGGLTEYLLTLNVISSSPHFAFSAFNLVLEKVMKNNLSVVQTAITEIVPTIKRFWGTKSTSLREEMLVTLMTGMDIIRKISVSSPPRSFVESLQVLLDRIYNEYTKLSDRELLQIDDLCLSYQFNTTFMGLHTLGPRVGVARSEQNWMMLWVISSLSRILDNTYASLETDEMEDNEPRKKQHLFSRAREFLRDAGSATGLAKICALQLVPFLLFEYEPELEFVFPLLDHLKVNILDENVSVATWSMIAISRYAFQIPEPPSLGRF